MTFTTRRRRSFSGTAALILALTTMFAIPAMADDHDKPLTFNQKDDLPITALDYSDVKDEESCDIPGIDLDEQDGWVFIHPPTVRGGFTELVLYFDTDGDGIADETMDLDDATATNQPGKTAFITPTGWVLVGTSDGTAEDPGDADARGVTRAHDHFVLTHTCAIEQVRGSILVEKSYGAVPGSISEFTVYDDLGDPAGTMTATGVDATTVLFCLDELVFGDYTVSETVTPDGFVPADDIVVTVDTESTCADRLAAADPIPDASITNPTAPQDLTVQKLKLSHDGTNFVETTTPLEGFTYTLYEGSDNTGEVVESSTTGTGGFTSFTPAILEVGDTYTVCETGVPPGEEGYWTAPSDHGANDCETFTVQLDQDVSRTFYNAPKADIEVGFTDVTGYASLTIVCVDANGVEVINETFTGTDSVEALMLDLGDYDCDIQVRNGSTS